MVLFTMLWASQFIWRWTVEWTNDENGSLRKESSSIVTTAHCGLWPVGQCPSIFSYLPPTLSIFLLPALEDLFLLPLSIFSWVFPFFSSLPVLEWRSFRASYPPPFSLGDVTSLSSALLSILLYLWKDSVVVEFEALSEHFPRGLPKPTKRTRLMSRPVNVSGVCLIRCFSQHSWDIAVVTTVF